MSSPGGKGSKAVAGSKGAAAEGEVLQAPPGQSENIRLTVAFAERYGLIARLSRFPAVGGKAGAFRDSAAAQGGCFFHCVSRFAGEKPTICEDKGENGS